MAVAAASAATASFTGLGGLGLVAGWPNRLAWLLPVTIDAYAMTSARVWLAGTGHTRRARRFAQANAIGAIAVSIVGNAVYHAISVGLMTVSWHIVVIVGAIPAAILGLTAHLHALRSVPHEDPVEDSAEDEVRTRTHQQAPGRTEDELMKAARDADTAYRADHDGRPITRDALRTALRISGPRATELRRRLAAEVASKPQTHARKRKEAHSTT
jgi:hypothetical protein